MSVIWRAASGSQRIDTSMQGRATIPATEPVASSGDTAGSSSMTPVVLRDVDARRATYGMLTLARTRCGPAQVRIEVSDAHGAWLTAAIADVPTSGGRHDWSDVAVEPGPAWDRLTAGVVDVRLLLDGAVRVGELLLT